MKAISTRVIQIMLASVFLACNNATTKPDEANNKLVTPPDTSKTSKENKKAGDSTKENAMHITAMFIEYTLGDASHYSFKDKSGKNWDFADNEDAHYKFAEELPKNKANSTNQGWGSKKQLQGKWFDIKYIYRIQPQYPDGPMAKVPVIIEATLTQ